MTQFFCNGDKVDQKQNKKQNETATKHLFPNSIPVGQMKSYKL